MQCACKDLPDYGYYVSGNVLSKKLRSTARRIARANWRELIQCKVCGVHWRIDEAEKYQERFIWKVGAFREDWPSVEFIEKEKALLLQQRGGEIDEKCAWLGCEKKKIKGVAYCIDHLYATGARR